MTSVSTLPRIRPLLLTALLALAAPAFLAGCAALTGDRDSRDRDTNRDDDRSEQLNVPPKRSEVSAGVPRTARLVARGTGPVTYRAREDGRVWIVEASNDRVLAEERVLRGDELRVEPERDRVTLNDRTLSDRDMNPDSGHRIFFEERASSFDRDREPIRDRDRDRY